MIYILTTSAFMKMSRYLSVFEFSDPNTIKGRNGQQFNPNSIVDAGTWLCIASVFPHSETWEQRKLRGWKIEKQTKTRLHHVSSMAKRFSQRHLQCSTCWAREAFSSPTSTPLSNLWALHMCQIKTSHCNFTNWSMHTTHQSINWNHFEFNTAKAGSKSWISWTSRMWIESFNFVLGFDWSVVEVVYPEARPTAGPPWLDLLTHCKMPAQGQHIPSLRPIFTRDRYLKSQRKAQTWLPNKQNMFHHAILYVFPVASYQYRLTFDSRLGSASCGSCLRHAIWSFGSSQPTFFAKVL